MCLLPPNAYLIACHACPAGINFHNAAVEAFMKRSRTTSPASEPAVAQPDSKRCKHIDWDASTLSSAQQVHQGTAQGSLSAGAAAVCDQHVADASTADNPPHDSRQSAAQQEQPTVAAGAGAACKLTVGPACTTLKNRHLAAALRAWAKACYPDASCGVSGLTVADLLPGFDAYLQHVQGRVACSRMKPYTAAQTLMHLRTWLQQQQHNMGGSSISPLLQRLKAEQARFLLQAALLLGPEAAVADIAQGAAGTMRQQAAGAADAAADACSSAAVAAAGTPAAAAAGTSESVAAAAAGTSAAAAALPPLGGSTIGGAHLTAAGSASDDCALQQSTHSSTQQATSIGACCACCHSTVHSGRRLQCQQAVQALGQRGAAGLGESLLPK